MKKPREPQSETFINPPRQSRVSFDVHIAIDLAEMQRVLTVPQIQAVMNGIAQVIAAQK